MSKNLKIDVCLLKRIIKYSMNIGTNKLVLLDTVELFFCKIGDFTTCF